jgi:hypothetical protein
MGSRFLKNRLWNVNKHLHTCTTRQHARCWSSGFPLHLDGAKQEQIHLKHVHSRPQITGPGQSNAGIKTVARSLLLQ